MNSYEVILKLSYIVDEAEDENDAYKQAIQIMKQDTHPEVYDAEVYHLED